MTLKSPSIDENEIEKFRAMASEWWDPKGKFKPLHKFNPVRLAFLRDKIVSHFNLNNTSHTPLEGLRILDIGCGGGLVSEPIARLGAKMTSVDAGEANIKTAMTHAQETGVKIDYRVGTVEELIENGEPPFDVVLNLEVIEHVADPHQFIKDTASLVKPGGMIFVASINRTSKAFALAIVGAEYIMGWLPKGTHEFHKLVKPTEAKQALKAGGISIQETTGVSYNPLSGEWSLSSDTMVNYMCVGTRSE
ncbi:bifunctional 2-polyprenyl-6-hydroxyphenol methylase/3-demethylubiquinol 3-O-methyltransferase UbiG [Hirschia baltica]|uniref:Ubiquinone biosynthesis O-methyltransferase n=1 Tax=Hirschia baltica (strain ATCC 49814 / DSM 5838 / IFAM 1418) TaxID=582402 RepID=C6XPY1_HIRBI|nr:bifunctional 2-polyprenyl-6-hydroxyphenol methylase/3-demethylubiquinol 3-O-methyltransferase UbiG [Hirschia baltica]ACT58498.1 ubiquinone biosynthesis O-methyltransferase [Hirschia baltica ATCC 49814]